MELSHSASTAAKVPKSLRVWRLCLWWSGGLTAVFPVTGYLGTRGVEWWLEREESLGRRKGGLEDLSQILLPVWVGILLGSVALICFLIAAVRVVVLKRAAAREFGGWRSRRSMGGKSRGEAGVDP